MKSKIDGHKLAGQEKAHYTQTLHKSVKLNTRDRSETIDFKGTMLDAGYLMLDVQE